jgi:hypothetical protein
MAMASSYSMGMGHDGAAAADSGRAYSPLKERLLVAGFLGLFLAHLGLGIWYVSRAREDALACDIDRDGIQDIVLSYTIDGKRADRGIVYRGVTLPDGTTIQVPPRSFEYSALPRSDLEQCVTIGDARTMTLPHR